MKLTKQSYAHSTYTAMNPEPTLPVTDSTVSAKIRFLPSSHSNPALKAYFIVQSYITLNDTNQNNIAMLPHIVTGRINSAENDASTTVPSEAFFTFLGTSATNNQCKTKMTLFTHPATIKQVCQLNALSKNPQISVCNDAPSPAAVFMILMYMGSVLALKFSLTVTLTRMSVLAHEKQMKCQVPMQIHTLSVNEEAISPMLLATAEISLVRAMPIESEIYGTSIAAKS